jgi:hypothetical protein
MHKNLHGRADRFILSHNRVLLIVLLAETVKRASLPLQCVNDIHGDDGLAACVFGVCYGVTDNGLEEDLKHITGFLIDEARDTLDTATASKATDCRLGDSLDVITKNLAMTLGTTLSESLTPFAAA